MGLFASFYGHFVGHFPNRGRGGVFYAIFQRSSRVAPKCINFMLFLRQKYPQIACIFQIGGGWGLFIVIFHASSHMRVFSIILCVFSKCGGWGMLIRVSFQTILQLTSQHLNYQNIYVFCNSSTKMFYDHHLIYYFYVFCNPFITLPP